MIGEISLPVQRTSGGKPQPQWQPLQGQEQEQEQVRC